jgi:imidazolonepropionase
VRRRGLLVEGAAQIATLRGGPRRGTAQADAALLDDDGAGLSIAILGDRIAAVGSRAEVGRRLASLGADVSDLERVDAAGCLVTPGLIDPHTHLLFAGARERELQLRQRGAGYLEILAAGGGILSTVERTRAATDGELLDHGRRWLAEMLSHGVTTAEVKSGYGLDLATELRLLNLARALGREGPVELVPTYLGAHAVPRELRGRPDATEAHISDVIERQLPRVADGGIARFCDVFCELGVFDADQSRRILLAGERLGLRPRLHADELRDSGGAALAAELGAASADHLAAISGAGIEALGLAADLGRPAVAVLLPATTLYLMNDHYAPARRLIERGVPVALGTDFNPGTSPTPNLHLVLTLACLQLRLSPQEALVAATVNAALALGLDATHGSIEPGRQADIVIWDVPSVDLLPYWVGADLARTVIKRGHIAGGRGWSTPRQVAGLLPGDSTGEGSGEGVGDGPGSE